jgi:predicted nucleotidyltransferase
MMNDRITGPIAGAGLEPCKVKKQLQLRVQDSNLAKLKQTKASSKQQTSESKHQQVQLQVQDLNLAKLNQTTTSNNRRTNEPTNKQQPVNQ